MKKILYSSTALAAATAIALIPTGDAVAAEKAKKISLALGGGMTMLVGYADQAGSFAKASDADVEAVTNYDTFNTFASSELHVKGSVKLDSGATVSVVIEFETDQATANSTTSDGTASDKSATIDHSYMKITGAFGDIRIGSTAPVTAVLSQSAPWTGALNPGVDDIYWVMQPAAVKAGATGAIGVNNGADDKERLQYISPQFAGARVGLYYTPDLTTANSDKMPSIGGNDGTDGQEYGLILNYENKFGASTFKASLARWISRGAASASLNHNAYGAQVVHGDVKVGGAYYTTSHQASGLEGTSTSSEQSSYNMGVLYSPKGYAIGLHLVKRSYPLASGTSGDDEKRAWTLGVSYDLGPGVTAKGSLAYVEYQDESSADSNNNKGWAAVAGIAVAF